MIMIQHWADGANHTTVSSQPLPLHVSSSSLPLAPLSSVSPVAASVFLPSISFSATSLVTDNTINYMQQMLFILIGCYDSFTISNFNTFT